MGLHHGVKGASEMNQHFNDGETFYIRDFHVGCHLTKEFCGLIKFFFKSLKTFRLEVEENMSSSSISKGPGCPLRASGPSTSHIVGAGCWLAPPPPTLHSSPLRLT